MTDSNGFDFHATPAAWEQWMEWFINAVSDPSDYETYFIFNAEHDNEQAKEADFQSLPVASIAENESWPSVVFDSQQEEHAERDSTSWSDNVRSYQCFHCGAKFLTQDEFSEHRQFHWKQSNGSYICQLCSQIFRSQNGLAIHTKLRMCQRNTDKYSYDCSKCGKSFKTHGKYRYHIIAHRNRMLLCAICGRTFVHKANLNRHILLHSGLKPYCCQFCPRRFSTAGYCKIHVQRRHRTIYQMENELSPAVGADAHQETHTKTARRNRESRYRSVSMRSSKYQCTHCNEKFSRKDEFLKHQRRFHDDRPSQCETCLRAFKNHNAMSIHKRSCQRSQRSTTSTTSQPSFDCSECGKSFDTEYKLLHHGVFHNPIRLPCPLCGERFDLRASLKSHMAMSHTGEKPHV